MNDSEKLAKFTIVLGEIARGRPDNGRPLGGETSRQMARAILDLAGLGWPKLFNRAADDVEQSLQEQQEQLGGT